MMNSLKYAVLDEFWLWMMRRHGTPMRSLLIIKFTRYWRLCQKRFTRPEGFTKEIRACADKFSIDRVSAYRSEETARLAQGILQSVQAEETRNEDVWHGKLFVSNKPIFAQFPEIEELLRGDIGDCIKEIFGSEYKIHNCRLFKIWRRRDEPQGSEIWHTDSHPGTCLKIMIHLNDVTPASGATELLPWPATVEVIHRTNKLWRKVAGRRNAPPREEKRRRRAAKSELFSKDIYRSYHDLVEQPCSGHGCAVFFSTNILHKGGFPQPGHLRYTVLATVYPSDVPPPFERYREVGTAKTNNYPRDPAEVI